MKKTIAVIEDDQDIGNALETFLAKEGYAVKRAYSGTEALYLLQKENLDLILLDLMLPGISGEEVLKSTGGIPVIAVSAKADTDDKISVLMAGAADYVTKPFDFGELSARIAVQLRKKEGAARGIFSFGKLVLNASKREVKMDGREVKLTKTEYAILKTLLGEPDKVFVKSCLLDAVNEYTPDGDESSLNVHVSNLRKKLAAAGGVNYIETVWGIGYKMADEDSVR